MSIRVRMRMRTRTRIRKGIEIGIKITTIRI